MATFDSSALANIPAETDPSRGIMQGLQLKDMMTDEQTKQLQLGQEKEAVQEQQAQRDALKGVDWTNPTSVAEGMQNLSKRGFGDLVPGLMTQYGKLQSAQTTEQTAKADLAIKSNQLKDQFLDTVGTNATDLLNISQQYKDPAQGFQQSQVQFMARLPGILQQLPTDQPWAANARKQLVTLAQKIQAGQISPQQFRQGLMTEIQGSAQGRAILQKQQADLLAQRKETTEEAREATGEKRETTMERALVDKERGGGGGLTPEGSDILSEAVMQGVSLPTGGSRSATVIASIFNNLAKQHPDLSAPQIVEKIKSGEINMKGLVAETSAVGRRQAGIETSAEEARNVIPIALKASADIPRGQFVPLNKLIQAGQVATSNPKLAAFAQANLTLANVYARAMSPTGTPTVEGREEALKKLSQATSPESYKAVVDVIVQEINAARSAPSAIAADIQARTTGGPGAGVQAPLTTGGAPAASAGGSAPITATGPNGQKLVLQNGKWVAQPSGQ